MSISTLTSEMPFSLVFLKCFKIMFIIYLYPFEPWCTCADQCTTCRFSLCPGTELRMSGIVTSAFAC